MVIASHLLHIKVLEDKGMLTVMNNLQIKGVVKKSSGVGLQNIKQRYAILTNRAMQIVKTGTDFNVHLPMLSQQIAVVRTQEVHIEENGI